MSWFVYYIAGGFTFFPGAGLIGLALLLRPLSSRRILTIISVALMCLGVMLVVLSAEAIPWWTDWFLAIAISAWFLRGIHKRPSRRFTTDACALAAVLLVVALAIPYQLSPSLSPAASPHIYVIGDSISAGIGIENTVTWPAILATQHHVQITDLSRAGATITDAARHLQSQELTSGIVILEIGGNDIIGHADPNKFGADFETLTKKVCAPNRQVVMLELPLFPLGNAYGIQQRRIAARYGIKLIPRRYFAQVLAAPNATVDGIHLSAHGQQLMARMIWRVVGPSLESASR